jgi:hypothetical protein
MTQLSSAEKAVRNPNLSFFFLLWRAGSVQIDGRVWNEFGGHQSHLEWPQECVDRRVEY